MRKYSCAAFFAASTIFLAASTAGSVAVKGPFGFFGKQALAPVKSNNAATAHSVDAPLQLKELQRSLGVAPASENKPSGSAVTVAKGPQSELPPSFLKDPVLKKLDPTVLPVKGRITSKFGARVHPISKRRHFHQGIDFKAQYKQAIHCPLDGIVTRAAYRGGLGNAVNVYHPTAKLTTVYAHMAKITVKNGQKIKQGDVVGLAGSTGSSTGVHLHFEVRTPKGKRTEPLTFLAKVPKFQQIAEAMPGKKTGATLVAKANSKPSAAQLHKELVASMPGRSDSHAHVIDLSKEHTTVAANKENDRLLDIVNRILAVSATSFDSPKRSELKMASHISVDVKKLQKDAEQADHARRSVEHDEHGADRLARS